MSALGAGFACALGGGADPSTRPAAAPAAARESRPSSGDAAADLVASFYQVLWQEQAPTIDQERSLFPALSSLRARLVLGAKTQDEQIGQDVEPMRRTAEQTARRRFLERKVADAGPVVLEYLRRKKDWFIPVGMKSAKEIQISSLWRFVRSVDKVKEQAAPGCGWVAVLYVRDRSVRPARMRTIFFDIANGKIDVDDNRFDDLSGKAAYEAAIEESDREN